MGDGTQDRVGGTSLEVAAYVADMTADLARIARGHGLDVLGYLLDMVRLEARSILRGSQSGGDQSPVS
ncbi:MAG: hypothetical protein IRZ09_02530 [Variibacter sp.]|nr:hypothetical protein [Variibacter sp.]